MEIPPGYVGLVRGRSGLGFKHLVWSFDGTIDEDYRGEIGGLLINFGTDPVVIEKGERFAQLVIVPVLRCELVPVPSFGAVTPGARGEDGFGSTGKL